MSLIDFILNLAGLLLWLNWLSLHFDPLAKTTPKTLVGTLRKADPSSPKRWQSLAAVILLVVVRAVIYWEIGPALNWTPRLPFAPLEPAFRSDYFVNALVFSTLSFVCALGAFYFSLLLLSVANQSLPDTDPFQKLVRLYFKWVEPFPAGVKILLPFLVGGLFWIALHPLLAAMNIVPQVKSFPRLLEQAAIIGIGTYRSWKYLVIGVLALHVFISYVYLGDHPVWNYVNATARHLLYPLRWLPLRIGKVDLLPILAIALVIAILNFLALGDWLSQPPGTFRPWFYRHLPF